jgi:hypothetical protein
MKGCKPLNLLCWPLPLYSCALGAEVLLLKYLCNTKYLRIIISHKYLILTRKTHPVRNSNRLCVPEEDVMTIVPLFYFRASWAGGERGLTLTRQLLAQLPNLLTKKGFALVSWTTPTLANHVYCFHPMMYNHMCRRMLRKSYITWTAISILWCTTFVFYNSSILSCATFMSALQKPCYRIF